MINKIEIDVGKTKGEKFFLDLNNERVLVSQSLGEIVDRIERELKINFDIKDSKLSKIGGFFKR